MIQMGLERAFQGQNSKEQHRHDMADNTTPAETRLKIQSTYRRMNNDQPFGITRMADGSIAWRPKPPPKLRGDEITTAKFAELTRLSKRRVQTMCEEGKLEFSRRTPSVKSWMVIPRSELERFLAERPDLKCSIGKKLKN